MALIDFLIQQVSRSKMDRNRKFDLERQGGCIVDAVAQCQT